MATKPLPSPELLRKLLRYEPETGKLFWLERTPDVMPNDRDRLLWNAKWAGKQALDALKSSGHKRGLILGRGYAAHRVAWAIYYGQWPNQQIDHIDGNPINNKINNLRDVSASTNSRNQKKRANNLSGFTGVSFHKASGKWQANITISGKQKSLGLFNCPEEAYRARKEHSTRHGYTKRHGE